jgi:hypothetical protein
MFGFEPCEKSVCFSEYYRADLPSDVPGAQAKALGRPTPGS